MSKVVLGFDYGTQKIGVAVGQLITRTASPLTILKANNGIPDWAEIESLIDEWQPNQLVVGLPLNMDGSNSPISERAEKFARRLHGRFSLSVTTVDERLSSREARAQSTEAQVDAVAAALILETWLAEQD